MITARKAQCVAPGIIDTSVGVPIWKPTDGELAGAKVKCPLASVGHPNRKGAQLYASEIGRALQAHLPSWRDRFSAR